MWGHHLQASVFLGNIGSEEHKKNPGWGTAGAGVTRETGRAAAGICGPPGPSEGSGSHHRQLRMDNGPGMPAHHAGLRPYRLGAGSAVLPVLPVLQNLSPSASITSTTCNPFPLASIIYATSKRSLPACVISTTCNPFSLLLPSPTQQAYLSSVLGQE